MKIKDGFILRTVAGANLVVAVGERSRDFNRMMKLNDTAAFLWRRLEEGCTEEQLATALTREFEVTPEIAAWDVSGFVLSLREAGVLD